MVARAALAPHAPCTPPPGCADAEPRNRPRIGVSARPRPGTGRKISCWCSPAVPPPSAPLIRFASRLCSSRGPRTRREMILEPKSGRVLLDPCLHPVGHPFGLVVIPASGQPVGPPVARRLLRHVRVGPERLGARR